MQSKKSALSVEVIQNEPRSLMAMRSEFPLWFVRQLGGHRLGHLIGRRHGEVLISPLDCVQRIRNSG